MSDLLPPNATPQERALAEATARLSDVPPRVRDVWDADTCPASLLPWLAWAYSVDEWDTNWSEAQKREAIRQSVTVHRYKGTFGAVREALAALGLGATVQEWFNKTPAGDPYTYDLILDADQTGFDQVALAKIFRVIESAKNLRSHMGTVKPQLRTRSTVYIGGASLVGAETTIKPGTPTYSDGFPALDLLMDAAIYGEASTIAALDSLDNIVRVQMPANSWAQE